MTTNVNHLSLRPLVPAIKLALLLTTSFSAYVIGIITTPPELCA